MIEQTNKLFSIDKLIAKGLPFAIYRAPRENKLHVVIQNDNEVYTTYDIEDINNKSGFVIAPFQLKDRTPLCIIRADKTFSVDINELIQKTERKYLLVEQTDNCASYKNKFAIFSEQLKKKEFEKLVLSRCSTNSKTTQIDIEQSFIEACLRYQNSYIYYFNTPVTGQWMGCTPELLLSNKTGQWMTVALAGTQSLNKGKLPDSWDIKNKMEQDVVSLYIRKLLVDNGITPQETQPYSIKAAELSHLRTDFSFSIPETCKVASLIKQLHPTPAVCGMPKNKAYQFIISNEGYNRKYYSGFIGMIDTDHITDLYVNLRCIHFTDQEFTLYAGGGLLSSSNMSDEWVETEKKMLTMKNILIIK